MTSPAPVTSVPVVPGLPLIGNLMAFRSDRLALQEHAARTGPIARLQLAHIPVYIVTDADLAHTVLVEQASSFKKSVGLQFLRPMLGDGLLTAEGETHRRHRKLLAPAFAPKRLAAYGDVMVAEGLELGMRAHIANLRSPVQLGYEWPLPRHRRMRRAVELLDEVVFRLIREGRARNTDGGDVLSILLLARDEDDGTGLTDQQVRDEVMTLLLAGHETTANALTWTWYELGRHPYVIERLAGELEPLGGRPVTADDLPRLPWNLAVIEEAMRLHPPAYMTGREAVHDLTLGGHRLPAGSIVAINIRGIHRRDDYFPAPRAFLPERMLPDAKKARPRHHYLPFGAGPRVCIGSHFALLEAQLALATMVQRVNLRIVPARVEPEPLVTLRPRGGMPAVVQRR